jgi:hypothetical protein
VLGLALTNHMSFMSTFAGAALYLLLVYRSQVLRPRILASLVAVFLLPLTAYAYLLIRSQAQPLFNWGNAHNLQRFYWHVTGKQYQVWMFSSTFPQLMHNLGQALSRLAQDLYIVLIPIFLWGAGQLYRKSREMFWMLAVVFVLNVLYAINYSIPNIESYYLPFLIAAFILTGIGLADIIRRLKRFPQYAFLLIVLLPLGVNYRRAGAQGNYIAEDVARNHLKSAPVNAIVMTTNWDVYAPIFYLRHVEHVRPDLCIIDKELLRRSWYFQSLKQEYPWLVERSQDEIDHYLFYLDQFEHGTLRDNAAIQRAYIAMIASFITHNPERRSFLAFDNQTDEDASQILPGRPRVPYGLFYEVESLPVVNSFDYRQFTVRYTQSQLDERTRTNLSVYERMATGHALALARAGRRDEAIADVQWVLSKFPGSEAATSLLSQLKAQPQAPR